MESNTKTGQQEETGRNEAKIIHVGELLSYLMRVKDGRKRRGIRYGLEIILVIFILAKLCGQNKIYGIRDWAQRCSSFLVEALRLKRKQLPHHSTYRRILAEGINEEELELGLTECFIDGSFIIKKRPFL